MEVRVSQDNLESELMSHFNPTLQHEKIARLAYRLWEERGRPLWSADSDWLHAERQLRRTMDTGTQFSLSSLRLGPTEY